MVNHTQVKKDLDERIAKFKIEQEELFKLLKL